MPSLQSAAQRSESIFATITGVPFPATLVPLPEGRINTSDYAESRMILRVRPECQFGNGTHIVDPMGRKFVMAEYDSAAHENVALYRTHRLFPLTDLVNWTREKTVLDPLTQQPRGTKADEMGKIWVMMERRSQGSADIEFRISEEIMRVVTGEDVQLNDHLNHYRVRAVQRIYGITVAEVQ